MPKYSHRFVEEYDGFEGFGFSRDVDEATITCYLQRFSDDELMAAGALSLNVEHTARYPLILKHGGSINIRLGGLGLEASKDVRQGVGQLALDGEVESI